MSLAPRIAAVTGGNKGLGLALVRSIAINYKKSALVAAQDGHGRVRPLLIYLTSRDRARGEASVSQLKNDQAISHALRRDNEESRASSDEEDGKVDVKYWPVDVCDKASIDEFAAHLKDKHWLSRAEVGFGNGALDLLINNAGISVTSYDPDVVQRVMDTNYHGLLYASQKLLPLMRTGGRIVNMSSLLSKLAKYTDDIQEKFRQAAAGDSVETVSDIMREYETDIAQGQAAEKGWPRGAYAVSKSGVVALTAVMARLEARQNPDRGVLINCCCPGYVSTDMTHNRGRKTVEEGAQIPLQLALGDIGNESGKFWEHGQVSSW